jgi:16S rRNA (guanine527-N7)-methyltransferase
METGILEEGLSILGRADPDIHRILRSGAEGIPALLNTYLDEIERFNPALSLVGAGDRRELVIKHILDSIAPLGIILRRASLNVPAGSAFTIADIGSGAGLPGIPLAILLPGVRFTLIERMGRRAGFLRNVKTALGLSNITIEEAEMEKAERGRFSVLCFRAFRPLEPALLKKLLRLLEPGGFLAAYKGRKEKIDGEMAALAKSGLRWDITACPVPFLEGERHIVLIQREGQ